MEQFKNPENFPDAPKENPFDFERFGYFILALLVFLLPVFFFPSRFFPVEISKVSILSISVVTALLLFLLNSVRLGRFEFPWHGIFWGALAVPAISALSALFGGNPQASFFGYGLEVGTWAFVAMGFVFLFVVSVFFRSSARILVAYWAFLVSAVLVLALALVKILSGGEWLSFGPISGPTGNFVGSWTDLAVFSGLCALLSVLAIELIRPNKRVKSVLYGMLLAALFVLAAMNFHTAWIVLLSFSILFSIYVASFRSASSPDGGEGKRRISYPTLVLAGVALVFSLNPGIGDSGKLGDVLSARFNISNAEIRPSLSSTFEVTKATFNENSLLGSGPNTFTAQWLKYKPAGVNLTGLWNVPFSYGFSIIATFAATTGIIGLLAWILFFGFYINLGARSAFAAAPGSAPKFFTTSSLLASLFLWAMLFLYIPSSAVFALAFFFTGLFIASAANEGVIPLKTIVFGQNAKSSFVTVILLIATLCGSAVFVYGTLARAVSTVHFQKALVAANEVGDISLAAGSLGRAINLAGHDIYHRALAQTHIARINQVLSDNEIGEEEAARIFQESLRNSITSAQNAINANPSNYLNWLVLGRIYESLLAEPLSVDGSYESAKASYIEALSRNPNSPEIYFLLARLEAAIGEQAAARSYIAESLSRKNNYADAYFLLTQLELREENIAGAIASAERAAILSPTNAGLFFQLGLLKYSAQDYRGAAEALVWAISIVPDYANAKYFLGLSLERLGLSEEAISEFEDLAETNPDNEEIGIILDNLRNGRDPFFNLPPETIDIETRPNPPITENEQI